MDAPLISVIVPIYNVEDYLHRCVDSIRNQSYTNLEIILVDDGSPDNCGKICDEYAEKDNRVVVVHRKNGGLSAARNSGINICKGEYIGFVDSDDCIHPQMYELLFKDIKKNNTILSFCQPNMCHNQVVKHVDINEETICYNSSFILKKALVEDIWWSACSKLYHKSIFNMIRFPEGRTNEDYPTTVQIFDYCETIAVNFNKLYNYCLRTGSITRSTFNIRKFDRIESAKDVYEYMQEHHPELVEPAQRNLLASCIGLLINLTKVKTNLYKEKKQMIYRIIRENFHTGINNIYLTKNQKYLLIAAYIHPHVFELLYKISKRKD